MLHLNDISYPKGDIEIEAVFLGKLKLAIQGLLNDIGVSKFSKTLKIDELFQEFSLFTTKYKNQGFEEECEVRLVASPHSKIGSPSENINGRKIFFRENEGLMIPTTNVFGVDVSPLPISKIIIGPNNDPEQYIKSIATYLRHQRLNIEVVQSEIPLRSI